MLLVQPECISIRPQPEIPHAKDLNIKAQVIKFQQEFGNYLQFPPFIIFKANHIFHKFNEQVSSKKFDRFLYAMACLFLSAKSEDDPQPIDRIVKHYLVQCQIMKLKELGQYEDQYSTREQSQAFINSIESSKLLNYKEKISDAEMHILKYIGYNFVFEGTSNYIRYLLEYPNLDNALKSQQQFKNILNKMELDMYRFNLCVYYPPKELACVIIKAGCEDLNLVFDINTIFQDVDSAYVDAILEKFKEYKLAIKGLDNN